MKLSPKSVAKGATEGLVEGLAETVSEVVIAPDERDELEREARKRPHTSRARARKRGPAMPEPDEHAEVGMPMTRTDLVGLLDEIRSLVAATDSWEGTVSWWLPDPDDETVSADTYAMVSARFRVGNTAGQGGMVVIGGVAADE